MQMHVIYVDLMKAKKNSDTIWLNKEMKLHVWPFWVLNDMA